MNSDFLKKIKLFIKNDNLIENGDSIVVGVSGGPDSMCLLHSLEQIRNDGLDFKITVAHINHMIRQNAILDEEFVKKYCNAHQIDVFIKRFKVEEYAKQNKIGTEEAGRKIRYEFFDEVMEKVGANKIATAHNANDNAETIILNIIRGCGLDGLKGIEGKNGIFIRPLINIQRDEIEEYCEENKLNPCIDESNKELIYQRNKVRNVMIPYVKKEFNENIIETLNRLSRIAKEEADYLEEITKEKFKSVIEQEENGKVILKLKEFNNLENVIKKRVVRYTIYKVLGNIHGIGVIHIDDIINMCSKNIGNKYLTPNKNIKVSIENKKIFFEAI